MAGNVACAHEGYIDIFDNGHLRGWVCNLTQIDLPAIVSFVCDGRPLGTAVANQFRLDLKQAGVGNGLGFYGFSFEVPTFIRERANYTIEAHVEGTHFILGHSPFSISESSRLAFRARGEHVRDFLAAEYIHGNGIEIGALHKPVKVPDDAQVTYVDSLSTEQLKHLYRTEVVGQEVVSVGIVTDAHTLKEIPDASQDFVIANQVVEHLENPLMALKNIFRVLRNEGVLFLSLPDKRYTFDRDRPVNDFAHVLNDYQNGPENSRKDHYRQWVRLVEKVTDDSQVEKRSHDLEYVHKYAIHFHVWSQFEMLELLIGLRHELKIPIEVEAFKANDYEALFIIRKLPAGSPYA
jgi:predicted SAM-dependent methyltransferase